MKWNRYQNFQYSFTATNHGLSSPFLYFLQNKIEKVTLFLCENRRKLGYIHPSKWTIKTGKVKTKFKFCPCGKNNPYRMNKKCRPERMHRPAGEKAFQVCFWIMNKMDKTFAPDFDTGMVGSGRFNAPAHCRGWYIYNCTALPVPWGRGRGAFG